MKSVKFFKWVALVTAAAALAGCAGRGELSGPKASDAHLVAARAKEAAVVFFREAGESERVPLVLANERVVGSLLPGRYAYSRVCSGDLRVATADRALVVTAPAYQVLSAAEGEVVYVQVDEPTIGNFVARRVDAEQAQKRIADLSMQSHIIDRHVPDCTPRPSPAPVVAAAPAVVATAPVVLERIQLAADALFRFDGRQVADMLPEGRASLDKLADAVKHQGLRIERMRVVGHTDRLGTTAYNQKLSSDRAKTVATYLRQKGLTQPMEVLGAGESEPITTSCRGGRATPSLIACLQPDRRVVIDLIGQSSN